MIILTLPPINIQTLVQLGLGESWSDFGLSTSRSSPCSYNGTKAKAEFEAITGCSANIPLDELSIPSIPDYDYFNCLYWDPYVFMRSHNMPLDPTLS